MKDEECHYSHSKHERKESSQPTTSLQKFVTVMNKAGYGASKPLETSGSLPSMQSDSQPSNKDLELRMARIESRLVKLMMHFGVSPQKENDHG